MAGFDAAIRGVLDDMQDTLHRVDYAREVIAQWMIANGFRDNLNPNDTADEMLEKLVDAARENERELNLTAP